MLASFLSGEFLLHIPCWIYFSVGSLYYTSHACFIFLWGVSLTHPMLASFLFFNLGSFSYKSLAGFIFMRGVSFTHPVLDLVFILGVSLTDPCLLCVCVEGGGAGFICIWGVSLTHPGLASFLSGEFLLHIPCWINFSVGSLYYTSHACFIFLVGSFSYTSHAGFFFIF